MRATITLLYTFIMWPWLCIMTMPLDVVTLHLPTALVFTLGAGVDFFLWIWVYRPGRTQTRALIYATISTLIFVLPIVSVSVYSYFFQHDPYSQPLTKEEIERNTRAVAPGQSVQLFAGDVIKSSLPSVGNTEFKITNISSSSVTLIATYRSTSKTIIIQESDPRYESNDTGSGIVIRLESIDMSSTGENMATMSFDSWIE